MQNPQSLYKQKLKLFNQDLQQVKKQLLRSSMFRLIVFLLILLGVYFFRAKLNLLIAIVLLGVLVFFFLVTRHINLQNKRKKLEALIEINQTELEVLSGKFSHLDSGKGYLNPKHAFSQDIDLFGENSFFQYVNRSVLAEGKDLLAKKFLENSITNIEGKQKVIRELGTKLDFRQEFSAIGKLAVNPNEDPNTNVQSSLTDLKNHSFFTPQKSRLISTLFSLASLAVILLYVFDFIPGFGLLIWLIIGMGISGIHVKKVNLLSDKVSKMQRIFQQYHQLLSLIEEVNFSAEKLKKYQKEIATTDKKASEILKEFSKAIDALDQRGNLLFGFLGNGFLLWDLRQSARLEIWIETYLQKAEKWFKIIGQIDAYNSLGNFAFNHPGYVYPTINPDSSLIKAENAVHPLIPEKEAVTNDFQIDAEQFFIITGANMAGKSTFLRTVALQIMMSNMGLPVRATKAIYHPIKLITSMRTVDSLAEESSYFYAELSRLKFIIDQLKNEDYFIILDEILKGTNSTDKAIGSRKFVEKLVRSGASGIIATHDLSLCEVADKLDQVKNYYFDAEIIKDELYFDYKLKKGICQNMNASFLLRKMEIIDE